MTNSATMTHTTWIDRPTGALFHVFHLITSFPFIIQEASLSWETTPKILFKLVLCIQKKGVGKFRPLSVIKLSFNFLKLLVVI